MADTVDLKSTAFYGVQVQVLSRAQNVPIV